MASVLLTKSRHTTGSYWELDYYSISWFTMQNIGINYNNLL